MRQFPRGFVFGASTAAYQVEGATREGGRGPSIWDAFCALPGKVYGGQSGDPACDQFHLFAEDVRLMREMGLQSYRFSIAWSRVMPDGCAVNEAGLDYYQRLTEELLDAGIEPFVTLYHWDLPLALEQEGGWLNRDTAQRFGDYATLVNRRLGDRIRSFVTVNEPNVAAFEGYLFGRHAPGRTDAMEALKAAHHLHLAHAFGAQALRSGAADTKVGVALSLSPVYPATDDPADATAAWTYDGQFNRWFLDPILRGQYPDDLMQEYESLFGAQSAQLVNEPVFLNGKPDFLGVNYYFPTVVGHGEHPLFVNVLPPSGPTTDMGWPIQASGLFDLLARLARDYAEIPIYITENGAAFSDRVEAGEVPDPERISYLREHLGACLDALAAGVDLRGYYVWSLLDNFEWAYGYSKRFGVVYVDFETQRRIPKWSADFYKRVIATGGLADDDR